ncbi:unnamed protein product [Mytilus edulis]|uniref:Uncharacterized protein n=1 Tax=Mytilus edulis TaxID=6550 RepID=A0A8S3U1D7_MYTED|nr:unnamed protein product [Mytilus edulis]
MIPIQSFSLSAWKNSSDIDPSQPLSQLEIRKLEETLKIAPFLLDNACQRFNSPYVPQTDGWRTGKQEYLDLYGIIQISYSIEDLYTEMYFLVNMKIQFCYESTEPQCNHQFIILQNTKLPKIQCDWNSGFTCPLVTPAMPSIEIPCHLSALCTGIECCVHSSELNRDFHTKVLVDACSYVVTVGIEDFVYNTSITELAFDFSLSNWKSERGLAKNDNLTSIAASELFEYLGLSYYLLSMKCNHYSDSYSPSTTGWKTRTWDQAYIDSGGVKTGLVSFSLEEWLARRSIDLGNITDITANDLITELGLSDYMGWSNICDVNTMPYNGSVNGWKNDKVVTENIGDTFQYNYSLTSGFDPSKYAVTVDLQVCYLADEFCSTFRLLDATSIGCSSTTRKKRRSKRSTTEPQVSDFKQGMRILMQRQASSTEIKEYIEELSEFLTEIVGGESDFFKSEDLTMWGEVPLPRRSKKCNFLLEVLEKRSTANCLVRQIPNQDYTEPQFEISIHAGDDRSGVRLYLDVGTVPGGRDVLSTRELAGPATILSEKLAATGVPLYFTVTAENDSGQKSTASCYLSTYDITPPGGRFDEDYKTTSNPSVIKASVTVYEDSELVETKVAMGYGKGIWGDQLVPWQDVELDQSTINHVTAAKHNSSDPHSGLAFNDVCLGRTRRDCIEMRWTRLSFDSNITLVKILTDGVPIWIKIRAINNVTVDLTEPVSGRVIDGNETDFEDIQFSGNAAKVEVQWRDYHDPESTIRQYEVQVQAAP